jgi:hypothetical protein
LSYDDTRERQLAEAAHFATRLARAHKAQIEQSFPLITGAAVTDFTPGGKLNPVTAVLWCAYLGHLVTYLTCAVGKESAAGILKEVVVAAGVLKQVAAHIGDPTRDTPH